VTAPIQPLRHLSDEFFNGIGPFRPCQDGQSRSALPGYFGRQFAPLSKGIIDFDAEVSDGAFECCASACLLLNLPRLASQPQDRSSSSHVSCSDR
jgi:hypothetical protein